MYVHNLTKQFRRQHILYKATFILIRDQIIGTHIRDQTTHVHKLFLHM